MASSEDDDVWAELENIASGGSDDDVWAELENIASKKTGLSPSQQETLTRGQERLDTGVRGREKAASGRAVQKIKRKGEEAIRQTEDVPIDVLSGADWKTRLGLAFRPTPKDKVKYLSNKYGAENISVRDENLFVRVTPEREIQEPFEDKGFMGFETLVGRKKGRTVKGKPYDLRIDEPEITGKDLVDMAGAAPDMVGAIAASAFTKNPATLIGRIGQILTPSAAGAVTGGISDVGVRVSDESEIDLQEIAERKGTEFLMGIALDGSLVGARAGIRKLNLGIGDATRELDTAIKTLTERGAIEGEIPMTLATKTGSERLADIEAFVSGASVVDSSINKVRAKTMEGLQRIQKYFTDPASEIDELGIRNSYQKDFAENSNEILQELGEKSLVKAHEIKKSIKKEMDYHLGGNPEKHFTKMAGAIRERASASLESNKSTANDLYGQFRNELTRVGEPTIPAKQFSKIIDKTYSGNIKKDSKQIISGFLQERAAKFQQAAATRAKGRPVVNQYGELKRIKPPEDLTFTELESFHKSVKSKLISNKQGDPANDALKKLDRSLSQTLEGMVSGKEFSKAKHLRADANMYWRKKVLPYRTRALKGLFLQPTDSGFLIDTDILTKLSSNNGNFAKELRSMIPSDDYGIVKRAWFSQVLESKGVFPDQGGLIDADAAIKAMNSVGTKTLDNVLGAEATKGFKRLKDQFGMRAVLKGKMAYDDYLKLGTVKTEKEAMELARQIRDTNANLARGSKASHESVTIPVLKGDINPGYLNRSRFIDDSYDKLSAKELGKIANKMSPDQKDDFARGLIYKIIRDSNKGAPTKAEQLLIERGELPLAKSGTFFNILRKDKEKIKSLLTNEQYDNLVQFNVVLRNISETMARGAGKGNLAAQSQRAEILMGGGRSQTIFATLSKQAKLKLYSAILAKDSIKFKAGPVSMEEFNKAVTNTLIGSQVLKGLVREMNESPRLESELSDYLKGLGIGLRENDNNREED